MHSSQITELLTEFSLAIDLNGFKYFSFVAQLAIVPC